MSEAGGCLKYPNIFWSADRYSHLTIKVCTGAVMSCTVYVWVCNTGIMLHQMGWKRVLTFSWYFNRAVLAPVLFLRAVNLGPELSSYSHSKPTSFSAYKLVLKLPPTLDGRACRMIISRVGNIRLECIIHTEILVRQFWISVDARCRPYLNQQG